MVLDLDFTAKVNDVEIDGINYFLNVTKDIDIEVGKPEAMVHFSLEPEAREYGIKSISVMVRKVTATINWWCYDDDLKPEEIAQLVAAGGVEIRGGTIEGTIEIDSTKKVNENGWEALSEMRFEEDGTLLASLVNIDLEDFTISVS